MVNHIV